MPKTYQVGDTAYQFPDDFSDDQVKKILADQKVISIGAKHDRAPRLKGTIDPTSSQNQILDTATATMLAGPILGSAGGMATAGALRRGLGQELKEAPGVARTLGKILIPDRVQKALGLFQEPQAPTPFQPNPATASKMRYGGPAPSEHGPAGTILPRKGFSPPETPKPQAPEPFKANPRTASKMRYGGPAEETAQVGTILPRKGFSPPETPKPQAPEPFKANPRTAQKMRYGGAKEEGYSPPPTRISRPSPVKQTAAAPQATEQAAPSKPVARTTETPAAPPPASKPPFVNSSVARHVVARNITIAKMMKEAGIKSANVGKLNHSHWAEFAKANGFETPNANSVKQIISEMQRLEGMAPSPKGRLSPPQ
jgi:hypothetical protein